jgi:hypothetical protein
VPVAWLAFNKDVGREGEAYGSCGLAGFAGLGVVDDWNHHGRVSGESPFALKHPFPRWLIEALQAVEA